MRSLATFTVFLALCASAIPQYFQPEHECIDVYTDFNTSKWLEMTGKFRYVDTPQNLPSPFDANLENTEGIFYYAGDDSIMTQSIFRSQPEVIANEYVYLRYYAHHISPGNSDESYYLFPAMTGFRSYFSASTDYEWKETFMQINSTAMANIVIAMRGDSTWIDDYLFIDKIIYAGSEETLYMDEVKALCTEAFTTAPPLTTPEDEFYDNL